MIIERLEQELKLAETRLDLTVANVNSNNDPEVLRARKTVETLTGLFSRVDAVLVEAVDDFPTIFDFSTAPPAPGARSDQPAAKPAAAAKPEDQPAEQLYDEHSLTLAAEKAEWARKMHAKGYVSKAELDRNVATYESLKSLIDSDIARAADRVDWARRMFEKGYVTKRQYDSEILRHFDAMKARLSATTQAVNEDLLRTYENYKDALKTLPVDAGTEPGKPNAPAEKPAAPSAKGASNTPE